MKAEAGGSQVLTGQPRLQTKILFKFKKEKKEKKIGAMVPEDKAALTPRF